jgi:zinc carboxypeptidase
LLALVLGASMLAAPQSAGAALSPPWDGNPISAGLGPTYGERWCASAAPGSSIDTQQGAPLALLPYEAIGCTLAGFQTEATNAGVPHRLDYSIIGRSAGGRDIYGAVVNALETAQQRRDYQRWKKLRTLEITKPAVAQAYLDSWGGAVKLPIFIENNIHGGEEEGADAWMQIVRDLVTTPHGANPDVDNVLDHAIVVVVPTENPDGRFLGTRTNANGFDMNRDWLVQSQSEVRAEVAFQQEWLAPVGLATHGYYNPTLTDGLTKPHNPGLDYDLFVRWNQRRLDANEAALNDVGYQLQRPVNDWDASGNGTSIPPTGPQYAEGWDDWGPFYTQTYMAFYGVDSSTVEMCSDTTCGGRLGSKTNQYLIGWSSMRYWIGNRHDLLHDQLEIFRRGVTGAARPDCCGDPLVASRGFTEAEHDWMVPYPQAFVIPLGAGQRSNAEANRLVQWLLDNGIAVRRMSAKFAWSGGGRTFQSGSYVVRMAQAFRGLAFTALTIGQDISSRIGTLYAPPGAWSLGYVWGADVVEIPADDATFTPTTKSALHPKVLGGGVRSGRSDWYAIELASPTVVRAVNEVLNSGVNGEIAETAFTSTTGGLMPAGSAIFGNDSATVAALTSAGHDNGVWFERNRGVAKPPTSILAESPRIAVLGSSASLNDITFGLRSMGFAADAVQVAGGTTSIDTNPTDPLLDYDVIWNSSQAWPGATSPTARARIADFFARGGGYLGSLSGGASFVTGSTGVPSSPYVSGLTYSSQAGSGILYYSNAGGPTSPITGMAPSLDTVYASSPVSWYGSVPGAATVDGRYLGDTVSTFAAGLWRTVIGIAGRDPAAASAPIDVHGTTTLDTRYAEFANNPFSRSYAERTYPSVGSAAFWSNLTDEP